MQALVAGDRHTITTTAQVQLQRGRHHGAPVQVDPIKSKLQAPGTKRLKLT